MRYIFELNHPKHYYQFREVMHLLQQAGHQTIVLARDKDVLLSILDEEQIVYKIFGRHSKHLVSKVFGTFFIMRHYMKIVHNYQPDIIVSKASLYGCLAARRYGCRSIVFPDSEVVALTNKVVVPLCSTVITPDTFGLSYGKKHLRVKGFFENCYLSPSVYKPDINTLIEYDLKRPYVILRFIGWYANHDANQNGLSVDQKRQLVGELSKYMTVYISSEKELPSELQAYRLPTPAAKIHDVLAFADLYIGDSQTMATEAALLGTPAIRSNSFVGPNDMSNFVILEKQFGLLRNIASFDEVLTTAVDFATCSRKTEWTQKQNAYNNTVEDINQEIFKHLI